MRRVGTTAATLILIATALAGCFADDADDGTGTGPTAPADGNETADVELTLSIVNVTVGEPAEGNVTVNVTWSVGAEGNATGVEIVHNNVHWANHTVALADAQAGYGNGTADRPGAVPGEFTANLTVAAGAGTLYLRAHAIQGGAHYWSSEANVSVPEAGTTHIVTITDEALPFLAMMDPDPVTVAVGDRIVWQNDDDAPHTATADDGEDFSWDTGTIDAGSASEPIVFDVAGEFTYHCNVHPVTMIGFTVTVES